MGKRTDHRRVVRRSPVDQVADPGAPRPAPPDSTGDVVPRRAAEDTDAAWGDSPDSNDRRLREDVPPHW